ncbi:MAG TPA: acyl-CoA desaturase, partial [Solirubrobacteraceae bacterium]|nr:acyl-CoA desaturase [Solirubrobacteraceae bacterium]
MSRTARTANLFAVVIPFIAFLAALVLLWNRAVGPLDLAILAVLYLASGIGVTVGFHRLLTHRSFETHRPLKYAFAVMGSLSVQGPVITWVADHRKHHAHTDEEGDPHSPHVGHGSGLRGLLHAHMGWLMNSMGRAQRRRYAPELMEDPGMRAINRSFELIVVAGLAIPFALGYLIGGTLTA